MTKLSALQVIKIAVLKPYAWFAIAAIAFSPYAADIIKAVSAFFGK